MSSHKEAHAGLKLACIVVKTIKMGLRDLLRIVIRCFGFRLHVTFKILSNTPRTFRKDFSRRATLIIFVE